MVHEQSILVTMKVTV